MIGAGFCGSVVATKAADLGLRVMAFDSREPYPDAFRAEKLEQDQFEALEELGLIDLIRPDNSKVISTVHVLKGKKREVPCHKHRGIDYSATADNFRSVLRNRGLREVLPRLLTRSAKELDLASFYQESGKRRVDDNTLSRWRWASQLSTSRSLITALKRVKRKLANLRIRNF